MAEILIVGSAVVDFVFATDEMPTEARKYRAAHAEVVGGGCAANAAVAVSRLGGTARLGARLGQDQMGDLVLTDLQSEGIQTELVQRSAGGMSSFSSIYVDRHGERQLMNFRGSGLTEDTGWVRNAPTPDAVLVDTRWPEAAYEALKLARDAGVPGVVDGEPPIDPRLLEMASHIAFSRDGLLSLSAETDLALALTELSCTHSAWMCVTDGENGTFYAHQGTTGHVPAFKVDVVDTLAAGDVWHGAFALALAEKQDEPAAARFANAAAALKCTTFGGRKGCPDRNAVETFIKETT